MCSQASLIQKGKCVFTEVMESVNALKPALWNEVILRVGVLEAALASGQAHENSRKGRSSAPRARG